MGAPTLLFQAAWGALVIVLHGNLTPWAIVNLQGQASSLPAG